jgi:hypothetical protein
MYSVGHDRWRGWSDADEMEICDDWSEENHGDTDGRMLRKAAGGKCTDRPVMDAEACEIWEARWTEARMRDRKEVEVFGHVETFKKDSGADVSLGWVSVYEERKDKRRTESVIASGGWLLFRAEGDCVRWWTREGKEVPYEQSSGERFGLDRNGYAFDAAESSVGSDGEEGR